MAALARTASALMLGLLVTLLLLLTMHGLILRDSGEGKAPAQLHFLDFRPKTLQPEVDRPPPSAQPQPQPKSPPLARPTVQAPPAPQIRLEPMGDMPLELPDIRQQRPLRLDLDVLPETPAPVPSAAPATAPESAPAPAPTANGAPGNREVRPVFRIEPLYPRAARRRGIEGYVVVEFTVTANGNTRDVRVIESDPPGVFDQAAISAARQFRFQPRIREGRAVAAPGVRNRITFRLE